jgi:IS1 family transposase
LFLVLFQLYDSFVKLVVDGRFWKPIIRPTSGAVETENSLVNNELRSFRQQVASVHRSAKAVEKEVLTAACNAVEFASR